MALIFRVNIGKLHPSELRGLCKVTSRSNNVAKMQVAFISRKIDRLNRPPRPAPFPYKEKEYTMLRSVFDPMTSRFDDNTKVIAVEGSIAVGKTKLAKVLAEELEMLYIPPMTFEEYYMKFYDVDVRQLNSKLKPALHFMDDEQFCNNPHHVNAPIFQFLCLHAKFSQYMQALVHILSTGQGVVYERTPYSDFVFMLAMIKAGYARKEVYPVYKDMYDYICDSIMKPHVVIYLDAPSNVIQEKIKERGVPYEVNSKAFTQQYLDEIENGYKQKHLKEMSSHSHVLVYDWSHDPDPEIVLEDLEKLTFDFTKSGSEMYDWNMTETEFVDMRTLYSLYSNRLEMTSLSFYNDVPELLREATDNLKLADMTYALLEKKKTEEREKDIAGKGFLYKAKTYFYPPDYNS